jgi:hypothetical protein
VVGQDRVPEADAGRREQENGNRGHPSTIASHLH